MSDNLYLFTGPEIGLRSDEIEGLKTKYHIGEIDEDLQGFNQEMTVIFNRWGNILFDTDDPLIRWDGKSRQTGLDCPAGTYFFVTDITYQGTSGEETLHLQGSITLVR